MIKIMILSPAKVEDVRSGLRQNNRAASDGKVGLPCEIAEELLEMLKSVGRKMVKSSQRPIGMASVSELLDNQVERIIIEAHPQILEGTKTGVDNVESEDNDDILDVVGGDVEADNVEPLLTLTLNEARVYASRSLEFVVVSNEFVKKAGPSIKREHSRDLDVLVHTLGSMNETTRSRQANLLDWVAHIGSTGSCD